MVAERLMTLDEAARYLNIHPVTLYRWAKAKKIPASKIGRIWRFRREKIDAWLERQEDVRLKRG